MGRSRHASTSRANSAPECTGRRALVAASDASPDGRRLLGTLGIDAGDGRKHPVILKIILIEFR